MLQNCFDRFEAKLGGKMFAEDGRFSRDLAMEKVDCILGPKLGVINPPMHVPILSSEWNPAHVSVNKIDVSRWEGSNKFCIVLQGILSEEECQHLIDLSERRGYDRAQVRADGERQHLSTDAGNNDRCIFDDSQLTEQIWQRVLKATTEKDKASHHALTHVPWVNERQQKRDTGKTFSAVGLNERMRILRSDLGAAGAPHCDSPCVRHMEAGVERYGEQSFLSFQLYLNEDFDGGATRFLPEERKGTEDENETENENRNENSFCPGQLNPSKRARTKPSRYDVTPRAGSVLLFQHDCCHEETAVRSGRKYTLRSDVMYTSLGPGMEYARRPIMARQLDDLY